MCGFKQLRLASGFVAKDDSELLVSCLYLPSVEIPDVCHYAQPKRLLRSGMAFQCFRAFWILQSFNKRCLLIQLVSYFGLFKVDPNFLVWKSKFWVKSCNVRKVSQRESRSGSRSLNLTLWFGVNIFSSIQCLPCPSRTWKWHISVLNVSQMGC